MIENQGDKEESDSDSEPSRDEIHKTDDRSTTSYQQKKCTNQPGWSGWYKNPEYVFGVCLTIFTFILTTSTVYQATVMEDQSEAMLESNRINREALVSVQRAFVFPKQQPIGAMRDANNNIALLSFAVDWENSGSTPTKDLTINIDSKAFDAPPKGDMFPDNKRNLDIPLIIGPKATISSDSTRVFGEELKAVQDGKKFLFVWGRARYRDIFTGTDIHRTRFVYEVSWNKQAGLPMIMHHRKFNCADEECDRQEKEETASRQPAK